MRPSWMHPKAHSAATCAALTFQAPSAPSCRPCSPRARRQTRQLPDHCTHYRIRAASFAERYRSVPGAGTCRDCRSNHSCAPQTQVDWRYRVSERRCRWHPNRRCSPGCGYAGVGACHKRPLSLASLNGAHKSRYLHYRPLVRHPQAGPPDGGCPPASSQMAHSREPFGGPV